MAIVYLEPGDLSAAQAARVLAFLNRAESAAQLAREIERTGECRLGRSPVAESQGENAQQPAGVAEAAPIAAGRLQRQALDGTQPYRLVLLDADLLGDDFKRLDQLPMPRDHLVPLLKSDLQPDTVSHYAAAGMTSHLVKPIKQHDLWDLIISILGLVDRQPQAATHVVARRLEGPRLHILLADDNLAGQLIGRQTLLKMGHTIEMPKKPKPSRKILPYLNFIGILLLL